MQSEPANPKDKVYPGEWSTIFWSAGSSGIRDTAANVLTSINAAASAEIPGVNKFGRNFDIDTATLPEDIWDVGGVHVPITAAQTLTVTSANANDTAAGTGAQSIRIWHLPDWDTEEESQDVALTGGSFATAFTSVCVHRAKVLGVGTVNGSNIGDITISATTDGTNQARITAGYGQTLMAIYGVPSTQILKLEDYYLIWNRTGQAANEATCNLLVKEDADLATGPFNTKHSSGVFGSGTTGLVLPFRPKFPIPGPALVKIQCESVSANDTQIGAGFNGELEAA